MSTDPCPHSPPDPWNTDAWTAGVDSWWKAMATSRQVLQDLGDHVQTAVRGHRSEVRIDDLQQVVAALGLIEEKLSRSAEQGTELAERIDRVEAQVSALSEQVAIVARTVSALGGHIEALARAAAPQKPAARKAATRKPAAGKAAAFKPAAATATRKPAARKSTTDKPAASE